MRDRVRKAAQRKKKQEHMIPHEKLFQTEYERQRKRDQRAKKKTAAVTGTCDKEDDAEICGTPCTPMSHPIPFSNSASLGRAISRAKKTLPKSPSREVRVIAALVCKFTPRKRKLIVDAAMDRICKANASDAWR